MDDVTRGATAGRSRIPAHGKVCDIPDKAC